MKYRVMFRGAEHTRSVVARSWRAGYSELSSNRDGLAVSTTLVSGVFTTAIRTRTTQSISWWNHHILVAHRCSYLNVSMLLLETFPP